MLQIILLILSVISALPDFIDAVKNLWERISHVQDPALRRAYRKQIRQLVVKAAGGSDLKTVKPMSSDQTREAVYELSRITSAVEDQIYREHETRHGALNRLVEMYAPSAQGEAITSELRAARAGYGGQVGGASPSSPQYRGPARFA